MGTQSPPHKGVEPLPNFRPIYIVAKRLDASSLAEAYLHTKWHLDHQDATWYGGRPQPRRLCVRWGPRPLPQKGRSPTQFSAYVYCGQTAAWIKIPLATEVGLGLRDIVFVVDQLPQKKRHSHPHPIFGPCLLWPNGWMDEDAAWYGTRPRPRPHCTRRGPSSCERGTAAPSFRPMST